MRVFVTGATGFVGSAVVEELLSAGHEVLGLARSEAGAAALEAAGAGVHRGTLEDHAALQAGAAQTDAVIHTAFNHDFSRFADSCVDDRLAIEALGVALQGSQRPLIVTSGLARLASGRLATEADTAPAPGPAMPRQTEAAAASVVARGVKASVMRLAPSVHGEGDHGFVPMLIALARAKGVSAYIGEGRNRWAGVHRRDAARAYRLAMEQEGAGPWHAVADEGILFRDIAAAIGRGLGLPVVSLSGEAAAVHFGWFLYFAGMDMAASSAQTRVRLGWTPAGPGLLEDLERAFYFGRQA